MNISDALAKVFAKNSNEPKYKIWKHRLRKNKLTIDKQEAILNDNGYRKTKEAVWKFVDK